MISIVIPTYNVACVELVTKLARQASLIDGLAWEIVVADDASSNEEIVSTNRNIDKIPHCRFIRRNKNMGRARIRNFLAREAQGEWLLYIDGDGQVIVPDYLAHFVKVSKTAEACYGGYRMMPGPEGNLRWLYEQASAKGHTVEKREANPFKSFNISNLLIKRDLMLSNPLDERFVNYGYEDVMLGKQLQRANIKVKHIHAPIGFFDYEDNAHFVSKTEEGLQTLFQFKDELNGYSKLLHAVAHTNPVLKRVFLWFFHILKNKWRKNLTGPAPSLIVFKLYKFGYFLSLSQHAKAK